MSIKQITTVLGAVALAVVVGQKLSGEAMAIVIGVVCGVAAGIPTSALLLVVLTRRDRQHADETAYAADQEYATDQVIIIDRPQALPPTVSYWPQSPTQPTTRQWHLVGGDDLTRSDRP